jgi:tetratricopeptide (TPR) repeat protein
MYLLLSKQIGIIVMLLAVASCSMTGGQRSSENDWSKVPEVYIKALTAAKSDDKVAAVKLLKQTISVAPTFSPAYTNLGLQELRAGQLELATANFKKSIQITEHNPVSYHYLGVIARMQGEFDQALGMYRKAIEQEPRYPAVYLNAGILLDLYMYDFPAALDYYQRYQELSDAREGDVSKWIIDLKRRIAKGDV